MKQDPGQVTYPSLEEAVARTVVMFQYAPTDITGIIATTDNADTLIERLRETMVQEAQARNCEVSIEIAPRLSQVMNEFCPAVADANICTQELAGFSRELEKSTIFLMRADISNLSEGQKI